MDKLTREGTSAVPDKETNAHAAAAPLVSVLVPCYNEERYLARFLDSVLSQSYPAVELILVDDGSVDRSPEIACSYRECFAEKHFDFLFLRSEENRGQAAAINIALKHCRGDYLMWADSDDILLPDNVAEKVAFLEKHPECGFVLCSIVSVDENDLDTPLALSRRKLSGKKDPLVEDLLRGHNVVYGPGTILVRREAFREAIPSNAIYESRQGQNYQLMLPLAYKSKCGYLDKALAKYVIHPDSHSNRVRSFEEYVARQREFVVLIRETLEKIPGMTETDYTRYMKIAHEQLLNSELCCALQYRHFFHYYRVRGELKKKDLQVQRRARFMIYYGRKIKRLIKEI